MKNLYSLSMALTAISLAMAPMASEAAKMIHVSKNGIAVFQEMLGTKTSSDNDVPHVQPSRMVSFRGDVTKFVIIKDGDSFKPVREAVCQDRDGLVPFYDLRGLDLPDGKVILEGNWKAFDCQTALSDIGEVLVRLRGALIMAPQRGPDSVTEKFFLWGYETLKVNDQTPVLEHDDWSGHANSSTTDLGLSNLSQNFQAQLKLPQDGETRSKEAFFVRETISDSGSK